MRFKSIFTKKNDINNVDQDTGQMVLCEDSGELYFDTPTNGRVLVGSSGLSKTYSITLPQDSWTYNGTDYVQLPDYSTEIFRGKMYDDDINVVVTPSQLNTENININARVSEDGTRLEFVADILPTTDIIMNIMTV